MSHSTLNTCQSIVSGPYPSTEDIVNTSRPSSNSASFGRNEDVMDAPTATTATERCPLSRLPPELKLSVMTSNIRSLYTAVSVCQAARDIYARASEVMFRQAFTAYPQQIRQILCAIVNIQRAKSRKIYISEHCRGNHLQLILDNTNDMELIGCRDDSDEKYGVLQDLAGIVEDIEGLTHAFAQEKLSNVRQLRDVDPVATEAELSRTEWFRIFRAVARTQLCHDFLWSMSLAYAPRTSIESALENFLYHMQPWELDEMDNILAWLADSDTGLRHILSMKSLWSRIQTLIAKRKSGERFWICANAVPRRSLPPLFHYMHHFIWPIHNSSSRDRARYRVHRWSDASTLEREPNVAWAALVTFQPGDAVDGHPHTRCQILDSLEPEGDEQALRRLYKLGWVFWDRERFGKMWYKEGAVEGWLAEMTTILAHEDKGKPKRRS